MRGLFSKTLGSVMLITRERTYSAIHTQAQTQPSPNTATLWVYLPTSPCPICMYVEFVQAHPN